MPDKLQRKLIDDVFEVIAGTTDQDVATVMLHDITGAYLQTRVLVGPDASNAPCGVVIVGHKDADTANAKARALVQALEFAAETIRNQIDGDCDRYA